MSCGKDLTLSAGVLHGIALPVPAVPPSPLILINPSFILTLYRRAFATVLQLRSGLMQFARDRKGHWQTSLTTLIIAGAY